jgi:hypothetical protein
MIRPAPASAPIAAAVPVSTDGSSNDVPESAAAGAPEQQELGRGSVLIVQPGTALQLSNRHDDELRLFVYGAPPERGEATFLPTIE